MLNKEKYAKEIAELAVNNEIIALKDNKPISCPEIKCDDCGRNSKSGCSRRILTEWANLECKEDILTEKEKAYLSAVIKPFRKFVRGIKKLEAAANGMEKISLYSQDFQSWGCTTILPPFKKSTGMFQNMKLDREYTPEELGL